MSIDYKTDKDLLADQEELRKASLLIDTELRFRRQKRELEKNRSLVPEWDQLLKLSYFEGYHTGVTWKNNYTPGGPMVWAPCEARQFHRNDMTHEQFNARAVLSKTQHEEWMRGFHEGRDYCDQLIRTGCNESIS